MDGLASLVSACALFVGSHFVMSHPARAALVARLGNQGFQLFYTAVSLASFGWMVWAFWNTPVGTPLWAAGDGVWIVASILTLLASVLLVGSFVGNPALPQPGATALAEREPSGMFRVTRHPMMWGIALWALSHILVAPRGEVIILMGSLAFLALAGSRGQDWKKEATMGDAWKTWEARTSFWPRLSQLPGVGIRLWLAGTAFWLVATWAHNVFGAYAAGIFRWL